MEILLKFFFRVVHLRLAVAVAKTLWVWLCMVSGSNLPSSGDKDASFGMTWDVMSFCDSMILQELLIFFCDSMIFSELFMVSSFVVISVLTLVFPTSQWGTMAVATKDVLGKFLRTYDPFFSPLPSFLDNLWMVPLTRIEG